MSELNEVYAEVFVYGVDMEEYEKRRELFLEYHNLMLNKTASRTIKMYLFGGLPEDGSGMEVNQAIGVEYIDDLNCGIIVEIPMETIKMMSEIVKEKIEKKENTLIQLPVPIRTHVIKEATNVFHCELILKAVAFRLDALLTKVEQKGKGAVWN